MVSIDSMCSSALAIIAMPVERGHYEDYFRWWAERSASARARYAAFLTEVHRAADAAGMDFEGADDHQRTRLLAEMIGAGASDTFHRVKTEVLALFVRTDAWLYLGYESRPGIPRGFANLDRVPLRAEP